MRIACLLDEILRQEILFEDTQHKVIGHVTHVVDLTYCVNRQAVAPNGIGAHGRNGIRFYDCREIGQSLALLVKEIVLIGIGKRIYTVFAGGYSLDGKAAARIGA